MTRWNASVRDALERSSLHFELLFLVLFETELCAIEVAKLFLLAII